MSFPQLVSATNIAGKTDYFAIVGEKYAKNRKKKTVAIGKQEYPLVVIRSDNTIRVQIGSWLAYSKQQQQQELKDLYTAGVIDQRTLLEHMEFGDIDTILQRTRQENILKVRRESQQAGQTKVSEEELARSENSMLLMGDERVMAMPQDDHRIHIAVHEENADDKLVIMHIQQHEALLKAQKEAEQQKAMQENMPAMAGLDQQVAPVPPPPMAEMPMGAPEGAPTVPDQVTAPTQVLPEAMGGAVGMPTEQIV